MVFLVDACRNPGHRVGLRYNQARSGHGEVPEGNAIGHPAGDSVCEGRAIATVEYIANTSHSHGSEQHRRSHPYCTHHIIHFDLSCRHHR